MHLGDFNAGEPVDFKWHTMVNGVMTAPAGSPAVAVYKNNGTTESTTGVTLTVNFDGKTGMHHVRVDTSADATFYASGSFDVMVSAGTLGGNSMVGLTLVHFSVGRDAALITAIRNMVVETQGSYTLQQALSIMLAAVGGRTSNGGLTFSTPNNAAVRITAAADGNSNRTAITLTPSA